MKIENKFTILHFAFEAIRFFPAILAWACVFARAAFVWRDLFSILSMVRTRESGIPKFSATPLRGNNTVTNEKWLAHIQIYPGCESMKTQPAHSWVVRLREP